MRKLFTKLKTNLAHFSWHRALDNYAKRLATWNWQQMHRTFLVVIIITCAFIGLKYPFIGKATNNGITTSIYDASTINRTVLSDEASFYEYPETKETQTSQGKGPYFLYSQGTNGEIGFYYSRYALSYDLFGRLLTKNKLTYTDTQEAQDIEFQPGSSLKVGAYMYLVYTRYGVDCVGCTGQFTGHGNFGVGVHYDKDYGVRQFDGTYKQGITYQGYYIIAADPAIPYCTVLRIENHRWTGAGLVPGVPFEVVVLDRGSAITGNHIDLFVGMESDMQVGYGAWVTSKNTKATIVKFGKRATNSLGQRGCLL